MQSEEKLGQKQGGYLICNTRQRRFFAHEWQNMLEQKLIDSHFETDS